MTREVLAFLKPEKGGVFVDCTVGMGGHTRALLEAGADKVIGLDRDHAALEMAAAELIGYRDRVELVHSDYRAIESVLDARGIDRVDGALADMGMSSYQLEAAGRGFSFQRDDPLDMRMDTSGGATAADLLRSAEEKEIADAIYQFGEERFSRRIARAIVQARESSSLDTTSQLAAIVRRAVPRRGYSKIDPATRTFQALRIWVNRELEGIDDFLRAVARRLNVGACLVVLTFHSLEDRIVKHTFRALEKTGESLRILTRRPLTAGEEELGRNARARSAKLRVIERLA
jgi:16S rRNA (cytosine1402-N4)-methyltransferase